MAPEEITGVPPGSPAELISRDIVRLQKVDDRARSNEGKDVLPRRLHHGPHAGGPHHLRGKPGLPWQAAGGCANSGRPVGRFARYIKIIERHTGRKVIGFMSSSQQAPSLIAQVFVLETSPLVRSVTDEPD